MPAWIGFAPSPRLPLKVLGKRKVERLADVGVVVVTTENIGTDEAENVLY